LRPYSASGSTAAATFAGSGPRRRRPHHQRLALAPAEREAHEQGRVLQLDVVLLAGLLVLRERGAAAGTPLRCVVALVQPALLLDRLEEPPDVLDVRVAEGVVVVAPVHPHPEALRLRGLDPGELRDEVTAVARERRARPYSSISRFELKPSAFSTCTSTWRPCESKPFW
jgi:hypothetical protein